MPTWILIQGEFMAIVSLLRARLNILPPSPARNEDEEDNGEDAAANALLAIASTGCKPIVPPTAANQKGISKASSLVTEPDGPANDQRLGDVNVFLPGTQQALGHNMPHLAAAPDAAPSVLPHGDILKPALASGLEPSMTLVPPPSWAVRDPSR